jgi:cytoskeleton protein RodZ
MTEREATPSVGACLRALREARGGSVEDMARATRVGSNQIEALEADRFEELPASVFVKGFIRAYCSFLGESSDEPLRRYRAVLGEPPPRERNPTVVSRRPSRSASPLVLSLVLLLVFGVALLAVNAAFKRGSGVKAPAPAPVAKVETAAPPSMPAPAPAPGVATPMTPAPAAAESAPAQRLVVRAVEKTWIRVQSDDGRFVDATLEPGATREWTAERRFLLTIGNAGGIENELNGRVMPRLGERGAVIRQLELPQQAAAGS